MYLAVSLGYNGDLSSVTGGDNKREKQRGPAPTFLSVQEGRDPSLKVGQYIVKIRFL